MLVEGILLRMMQRTWPEPDRRGSRAAFLRRGVDTLFEKARSQLGFCGYQSGDTKAQVVFGDITGASEVNLDVVYFDEDKDQADPASSPSPNSQQARGR